MADDPFAFSSGTLTIGTGETAVTIPAAKWTRGRLRVPPPPGELFAGALAFEGKLTSQLDPGGAVRDMRCPGCGTAWVDLEPGHSWSSARGRCWTETRPIDEYGRLIEEGDDGEA